MKSVVFVVRAIIQGPWGFLLVQRKASDKYYPECWEFPGGHVKGGESFPEALTRIFHDDMGLKNGYTIDPHIFCNVTEKCQIRPDRELLNLYFKVETACPPEQIHLGPRHQVFMLVKDAQQLKKLKFRPATKKVLEELLKDQK